MLVLRFIVSQSFLVIFHAGGGPLNIRRLLFLIAAAKHKHACLAQHRVVHPIPRSPIDSEFAKPFTERLQSPNFPSARRSRRIAIFALARGSCRRENHSPNTSLPRQVWRLQALREGLCELR